MENYRPQTGQLSFLGLAQDVIQREQKALTVDEIWEIADTRGLIQRLGSIWQNSQSDSWCSALHSGENAGRHSCESEVTASTIYFTEYSAKEPPVRFGRTDKSN